MDNNKALHILGWVATATAMAMYVSYLPQIDNNLHGDKGNGLQPLVAGINCTLTRCSRAGEADFMNPVVSAPRLGIEEPEQVFNNFPGRGIRPAVLLGKRPVSAVEGVLKLR